MRQVCPSCNLNPSRTAKGKTLCHPCNEEREAIIYFQNPQHRRELALRGALDTEIGDDDAE